MCMYFLLDIVWVSSLITFHRLERERGGREREGRERERRERKREEGEKDRQREGR